MEQVFFQLLQTAKYGQLSNSEGILRECFGAAKMAYQLKALTKTQFYELIDQTVRWMNTHSMNL